MLDEGETVAIIGANGAGKSTFLRAVAGTAAERAGRRPTSTGAPIGATAGRRGRAPRHRAGAGGPPAVPLADCRGEPAGRRATAGKTPGHWNLDARLRAVPGPRRAPHAARQRALRRPAADGGDRPGADVEPARAALRRDQPRPRADRHPRHLRVRCRRSRRRAPASSSSSRTSCRRMKVADRVYCFQEGRMTLTGTPGRADARGRSTPPISGCERWSLARHPHPGRAARRPLCAVRGRAVADLRHHAAGQPRAWRSDRARRLPHPGARRRRSASIRSSPSLSPCR